MTGVRAAAKLLRDRAAELRTPLGRRNAQWHQQDAEMVACELIRMAAKIEGLTA